MEQTTQQTCPSCEQSFIPRYRDRNRTRRYCSDKCRQRFCSQSHYRRHRGAIMETYYRRRGAVVIEQTPQTCPSCEQSFTPRRRYKQQYCSDKCRRRACDKRYHDRRRAQRAARLGARLATGLPRPEVCPRCGRRGRVMRTNWRPGYRYRRFFCHAQCGRSVRWSTFETVISPYRLRVKQRTPSEFEKAAYFRGYRVCDRRWRTWLKQKGGAA